MAKNRYYDKPPPPTNPHPKKSSNFSKLRHAQCKTPTHIVTISDDKINPKILENNIKKSSISIFTAFELFNMDEEDVPNFSKLSVILKVRDIQKFEAVQRKIKVIYSIKLTKNNQCNMINSVCNIEVIDQEI